MPQALQAQTVEWPTQGNGQPRIRCKPCGQLLLDPQNLDDSLDLSNLQHRSTLFAALASAIGVSKKPVFDIRWRFQPCCMIRHRPVTALDALLENTELVLMDAAQHMDPSKLKCPECGAFEPQALQWHNKAASFKGPAEAPTIYLASRRRKCSECFCIQIRAAQKTTAPRLFDPLMLLSLACRQVPDHLDGHSTAAAVACGGGQPAASAAAYREERFRARQPGYAALPDCLWGRVFSHLQGLQPGAGIRTHPPQAGLLRPYAWEPSRRSEPPGQSCKIRDHVTVPV
jgi:hypothetical protein